MSTKRGTRRMAVPTLTVLTDVNTRNPFLQQTGNCIAGDAGPAFKSRSEWCRVHRRLAISIHLLGDIPPKCTDYVATGTVFRVFKTKCDYKLHKFHEEELDRPIDSWAKYKTARETNRKRELAQEANYGIIICNDKLTDPKPFQKKGFCFRMKIKKWNPFAGLIWELRSTFSQGINATFQVSSSDDILQTGVIGDDQDTLDLNWTTTPAVPDNYQMGSSGTGAGKIHCDFILPTDGNCSSGYIRTIARLVNLGAETDTDAGVGIGIVADAARGGTTMESGKVLRGTPDPFRQDVSPPTTLTYRPSSTFGWYWTGVHWTRPDWTDPPNTWWFGLVMTLSYSLTFRLPPATP